jgi:hypothetical protein
MSKQQVVWLDDEKIVRQTDKAVCVENSRGDKVWLPISQLGFYPDGRISVPQWLADEKELDQ